MGIPANMHRTRVRLVSAVVIATLALVSAAAPATAQTSAVGRSGGSGAAQTADAPDAMRVREQFMVVFKQYPPSLGHVLALDPALLANDAYLAPYPALVAFMAQHPDVKRNPTFYLSRFSDYGGYYRSDAMQMWEGMMAGVAVFFAITIVLSGLGWALRTLIDYRRWHRLSKVQAEAHAKLLDRFTANDELLAYVQSPAGNRFLQSAPISLDPGARNVGAPFGRILWSVQAGLVAAAVGVGLIWVSDRVVEEVTQPLYTMGVLALSLGAGFVLSAIVSYVLSRRLGLFAAASQPPIADHRTPPGA
jgi:hypothetical protein